MSTTLQFIGLSFELIGFVWLYRLKINPPEPISEWDLRKEIIAIGQRSIGGNNSYAEKMGEAILNSMNRLVKDIAKQQKENDNKAKKPFLLVVSGSAIQIISLFLTIQ